MILILSNIKFVPIHKYAHSIRKRKRMNIFFVVILFIVLLVLLLWWFSSIDNNKSDGIGSKFEVDLSGVTSSGVTTNVNAEGCGQVIVSDSETEIKYNISAEDLSSKITSVEIVSENGTVLATLKFVEDGEGNSSASGHWTKDGQNSDGKFSQELLDALRSGEARIVFKTKKYPKGELFGEFVVISG